MRPARVRRPCIERIDGARVNLLALSLGGSLPLHADAAARALLAFEPPEFWDEYLEHRKPEALTEKTPAWREALLRKLRANASPAIELVCDGAAEISRALGHDGPRPAG